MEENNVKNKIIALSGEPVSGKGTTVKNLIKKLEEMGYSENQIHLESTGNDFRKYFNSIIDLIANLNNEENLKQISDRDEIKVFFSTEEYRHILSTTIANLIKENTDLSNFSIQDANNREDFAKIRKIVDTLIDEGMKQKGEAINREPHPNEIWIIDSRLAFNNIPDAFSVRLTTNADIAGKRLFNDKTRGKEDSQYSSIKEATAEREERRIGERNRYLNRYGVDLKDENNYDLIIDTSFASPSDIADVILECEKHYEANESFGKKWTSPQMLLPLQEERETLGEGESGYNFEQVVNSIKEKGYLPSRVIEAINVDDVNYIIEGHHRNFAAAYAGKTLVPYSIIAKDDEQIPNYSNTARERANSVSLNQLYRHEWMLQKVDSSFTYKENFPELYEKIENKEGIEY